MLQSLNEVDTQPLSLSNLHLHPGLEALSRLLARRLRLVCQSRGFQPLPPSKVPPAGHDRSGGRGGGDLGFKDPRPCAPGRLCWRRGIREGPAGREQRTTPTPQVATSSERLGAGAGPEGGACREPVPTCPRFLPPRPCAYKPGCAPLPALLLRLPLPPGLTGKRFRVPLGPQSLARVTS